MNLLLLTELSKGHKGIMEAAIKSFSASWQYCHEYFLMNLKKVIPDNKWENVALTVKETLENEALAGEAQNKLV